MGLCKVDIVTLPFVSFLGRTSWTFLTGDPQMFTLEMVLLTKSKQFKWIFMVTVFILCSKTITSSTKQFVQCLGVLSSISKPNHFRIDVLA